MHNDTSKFVGIAAFMPWAILGFWGFEIFEAGWMMTAVGITFGVSLASALFAGWIYNRPSKTT